MFSRTRRLVFSPETRIVLIAGGGGTFGQAVLSGQPQHTVVVNVSRKRVATGAAVVNCRFDLATDPERAFRHLRTLLPFVDVFVYAAYSATFAPFEKLERQRALAEYELNVFTAMLATRLCAEHFWTRSKEENRARARKAVLISSGAGLGKTARPELASYSATKAALNAFGPYAHDYLFERYAVPVAVLAPGSLRDDTTRERLVSRFWDLVVEPLERYLLEKID